MTQQPQWAEASSLSRIHDHTQTHHSRRTPLDEWSACCRDPYLTTHNTHNRQTSKPLTGFEPTIPASERPQTHALDCAATGIGNIMFTHVIYFWNILGFEINNETVDWIQRITSAKSKFILQLILYCYTGNFQNQMNGAENCSVYCCGVLYLLYCVMKISLIQNVKLVHGTFSYISILG